MARSDKYREIFFAYNGPGPYPCDFCGEPVAFLECQVHHRDHDETNDAVENLGPAHGPCHNRHHANWRYRSPESYANCGKKCEPYCACRRHEEGPALLTARGLRAHPGGMRGKTHSAETRANMAKSQSARREREGKMTYEERLRRNRDRRRTARAS